MSEASGSEADPRGYPLYPLRLAIAAVFIVAGWGKLTSFGAWEATVADLGFPLPTLTAALVVAGELLGGIGVAVGVLTRFSAAVHSLIMVVALLVVRIFGGSPSGWPLDVALLGGSLALVINGPGRPTLGSVLGWDVLDPEAWLWERFTGSSPSGPAPAGA